MCNNITSPAAFPVVDLRALLQPVSTNKASIVKTASTQTNGTVKTEGASAATNLASVLDAKHEESMHSIGKLVHFIVTGSKENTELLIGRGGTTAVATVKNRWLNHERVQTQVRSLVALIVEEMKTWI
jgi:hypothetical protein